MSAKYESYEQAPEESIDVLWMGSSNTYSDICPVVMWHNNGFTGFNMGTANNVALFEYYQLEYLLKHNKPKLVVIDFSDASLEESPDIYTQFEPTYRKMADTMPDLGIKIRMVSDFCSKYESLTVPSFLFPLLRYHSRWEELTKADFNLTKKDDSYNEYRKGAYFNSKTQPYTLGDDIFTHKTEIVPMYTEYYQKMYDMCNEKGIEVLVTLSPNVTQRHADYEMAKAFAEKNNLNLVAFITADSIRKIGIDPEKHYYDEGHLNIIGQSIFSSYMGDYISETYSLVDHRGDSSYSDWDMWYEDYIERYNKVKAEMGSN